MDFLENWLNTHLDMQQEALAYFFAQSLIALVIFISIHLASQKSTQLFSTLQRSLYKAPLPNTVKNQINAVFRLLKPNFHWLAVTVIYYSVIMWGPEDYFITLALSTLLSLLIIYSLSLLITSFAIENVHSSTNTLLSRTKLKKISEESKSLSQIILLCLMPIHLTNAFRFELFVDITIYLLCFSALVYFTSKQLQQYKAVILKFIIRQFPSSIESFPKKYADKERVSFVFILLFLIAYLIKFLLIIHQKLLRLPAYKTLAAKILWIQIEQRLPASDEEEEFDIDETYEKWFNKSYPDFKVINTEGIKAFEQKANDILDNWFSEKITENDLMIYGHRGIGKTTCVKHWIDESEYHDKSIQIELKSKLTNTIELFSLLSSEFGHGIKDSSDLLAFDKELTTKKIVIIDNAENLFLSTVGGFESYKTMLSIVNLPLRNIFWIFIMGSDPYFYLNDVFGRLNQYSYVFNLLPWRSEEIRELIMNRHQTSRRKLVFDELLFSSIGNDELSSYSATADRCFLLLAELSNGNPSLAMNYWINAASKAGNFTIEIGIPERPSTGFLSDYSADLLFIYAVLIRHKSLNIDEASLATRQNKSVAQRAIKLGIDNGFIKEMENQRFIIKTHWVSPIYQFLLAKNYLHGN